MPSLSSSGFPLDAVSQPLLPARSHRFDSGTVPSQSWRASGIPVPFSPSPSPSPSPSLSICLSLPSQATLFSCAVGEVHYRHLSHTSLASSPRVNSPKCTAIVSITATRQETEISLSNLLNWCPSPKPSDLFLVLFAIKEPSRTTT